MAQGENPDTFPGGENPLPDKPVDTNPVPRPRAWTSVDEGAIVPVVWGTCRVPGVVLYEGVSFATSSSYVVAAPVAPANAQDPDTASDWMRVGGYRSAVLAFALGPIAAFVNFWRGAEKFGYVLADKLGTYRAVKVPEVGWVHTLDATTTLHLGGSNPAWVPPGGDPSANGQAWEGVAQLRSNKLALTSEAEYPEIAAEIRGLRVAASGEKDASARDVMYDLLTSSVYGLGLDPSKIQIDTGLDGLAASSFARWCEANDFRVSGVVGTQTKKEAIESLAACCFSSVVYSEGKVKVVPLGAETYTGNSVTYTPPTPVALDASDWADLEIDQNSDDEVFNTFTVRYDDRETNGLYEPRLVQYQDAAHAATYGVRTADEVSAPWIKKRERAFRLAQYLCKQSLYQRTVARFDLAETYTLIEPGDLISLDVFGTTRTFRIRTYDHNPGNRISVEATEVPTGSSIPIDLTPGASAQQAGISWSAGSASSDKADTDLGNVLADSVTAELLSLDSLDNLWPNGNSEKAPPAGAAYTAWDGGTGLSAVGNVEFSLRYNGGAGYGWAGNCVRVLHVYTGGSRYLLHRLAAQPGETYRFSAYAQIISYTSGTGAYIEFQFRDAAGTQIGGGLSTAQTVGGWTKHTLVGTAPAGTVEVWAIVAYLASTGNECKWDGINLKRITDADLLGDGAVTTPKIADDAITTTKITDDAVTTPKILAGAITAAKIEVDALQTSNYTGSGSGDSEYATQGAKLRKNASGAVPSLLVDPAGLKIGQTTIDNVWFTSVAVAAGHITCNSGTYAVQLNGSALTAPTRVAVTGGWGLRFSHSLPVGGGYHVVMSPLFNSTYGHAHPMLADKFNPSYGDVTVMWKNTNTGAVQDPASSTLFAEFVILTWGISDTWGA